MPYPHLRPHPRPDRRSRRAVAVAATAAVGVGSVLLGATSGAASPSPGAGTGPSSSDSPYLVRTVPGVTTTSLLTVGDSPTSDPGYRMVGVPDGLGAFDNGDGTFTVLMNHELRPELGTVRAHGSTGAFVSRWVIDKATLEVLSGDDLIRDVFTWNGSGYQLSPVTFNRLCSADLADPAAYYDAATGLGYDEGRLFTNGEEAGAEGRAFAHVASGPDAGQSYELPALGNLSFENAVSRPVAARATVTAVTDDSTPGQVYVHLGQKQADGTPAERAGLTGGALFGIALEGLPQAPTGGTTGEDAAQALDGAAYAFTGVNLGDVSGLTGAELEARSRAAGVTQFARPEDGTWTRDGKSFVFATTAAFTARTRLWQLDFVDPTDPAKGGTARVLVEGGLGGDVGPRMLDNVTTTARGQVLAQEDPGNQDYVAGVWQYDRATDAVRRVAQHDPARFTVGGASFLTTDEESSGIIPLDDILGAGYYLLDSQVHLASPDPELVEHGQLLLLHVPAGQPVHHGRSRH